LLGHGSQIRQILLQEHLGMVATRDADGRVLIWSLSGLQPLHRLSSAPRR
jgi:hypothetical protein